VEHPVKYVRDRDALLFVPDMYMGGLSLRYTYCCSAADGCPVTFFCIQYIHPFTHSGLWTRTDSPHSGMVFTLPLFYIPFQWLLQLIHDFILTRPNQNTISGNYSTNICGAQRNFQNCVNHVYFFSL
jgi:hypothetical protein